MSKDAEKYPLPYYARMEILLRIVDEIKGSKNKNGISDVYRNIKADKASKIFALRLGRFLGIVESDTKNFWLTDLGYRFSLLATEKKQALLAENLPNYYITFLKWIRDSKNKTMTMEDVKSEILSNFTNWRPSERVLHESLLTFTDVCEYAEIITFIKGSRGSKTRIELTDKGSQILSGLPVSDELEERGEEAEEIPKEMTIPKEQSSKNKSLVILFQGKKFEHCIDDEIDWEVVDKAVESLKKKWKQRDEDDNKK